MAKLYFKYGAMGSSKTANALITRFNYQERNMKVWLIKPSIDDRDGANIIRSRIGLEASADIMTPDTDIFSLFEESHRDCDVIITVTVTLSSPMNVNSSHLSRSTSCAKSLTSITFPSCASDSAPTF